MARRWLWAALFGLAALGSTREARAQFSIGGGVAPGGANGAAVGPFGVAGYGRLGAAYSGYGWGGYGYGLPYYGYGAYPYAGYRRYYYAPAPRTVNRLGPLGSVIRRNAFPRRDRFR